MENEKEGLFTKAGKAVDGFNKKTGAWVKKHKWAILGTTVGVVATGVGATVCVKSKEGQKCLENPDNSQIDDPELLDLIASESPSSVTTDNNSEQQL